MRVGSGCRAGRISKLLLHHVNRDVISSRLGGAPCQQRGGGQVHSVPAPPGGDQVAAAGWRRAAAAQGAAPGGGREAPPGPAGGQKSKHQRLKATLPVRPSPWTRGWKQEVPPETRHPAALRDWILDFPPGP